MSLEKKLILHSFLPNVICAIIIYSYATISAQLNFTRCTNGLKLVIASIVVLQFMIAPIVDHLAYRKINASVKNNKNNDEIIISDRKNSDELVNIINEFKIDENQAVVISGDKNVKYELVIDVMNILQQNDFKKIGLLVQNKQEKTSNKK